MLVDLLRPLCRVPFFDFVALPCLGVESKETASEGSDSGSRPLLSCAPLQEKTFCAPLSDPAVVHPASRLSVREVAFLPETCVGLLTSYCGIDRTASHQLRCVAAHLQALGWTGGTLLPVWENCVRWKTAAFCEGSSLSHASCWGWSSHGVGTLSAGSNSTTQERCPQHHSSGRKGAAFSRGSDPETQQF